MFRLFKNILFATNLSENCRHAFDYAAALATRYQATLVMLHVIEKMPDYVEGRLKGMLGEEQWKRMIASHENDARQVLIGKQSSNAVIREALSQFCDEAGIDDASCGYHSREILVTDGDVVEDVLDASKKYDCDLIIVAAREGWIRDNTVGNTIKSILRKAHVPVMVVPPKSAD
jgi:nucleotide-binding universal stress UspA family protein